MCFIHHFIATNLNLSISVHAGEYFNDKMHGFGMYKYAGGDVYEGQYIEGKKEGYGKYVATDGGIFDGEWKDGNFVGAMDEKAR
jgi:hypothetical protein